MDSRILLQRPLMCSRQRHALGKIDRRTTAERNNAVAAAVAVGNDAFAYRFLRRIRWRAGEYRDCGRIKVAQHLRCDAGTLYASVCDEHGRRMPSASNSDGRLLMAPKSKMVVVR